MAPIFKLLSLALLALPALAHPGPHKDTFDDIVRRELHTIQAREALERCKDKLIRNRGLHERRLQKREEFVQNFVRENNIERRNVTPYTKRDIHPSTLFEEIECVLTPETTLGPYYLESVIRQDVRETQKGVPLLLDIQFVNVQTCTPVPDLYVDIWSANSTGIYGGVRDYNTVGQTHLRGLWKTDADGILQMTSIFPGWYQNRAVHTHILAHRGGRVDSTGKYHSGGTVPHIGQLFFDMNLISQVQRLAPYTSNRYQLLPNNNDFIFQQQNRGYNAIMKTELVGGSLNEGVLAHISIGVNINFHNPDTGGPGLPNPTAKVKL